MSPTDNQDDLDAAQDRARRDHESREQAADDRYSEPVDIEAFDAVHSVLRVHLRTVRARKWAEDHGLDGLSFEPLFVERHYGPSLLLSAHRDGLTVSLDGRIADA